MKYEQKAGEGHHLFFTFFRMSCSLLARRSLARSPGPLHWAPSPLNWSPGPLAISSRSLATSLATHRKHNSGEDYMNFDNMVTNNKRGPRKFKLQQFKRWEKEGEHPDIPIHKYGTRSTGIRHAARWELVPGRRLLPLPVLPLLRNGA